MPSVGAVTLTQIVAALGYVIAGALAMNNMRWRLRNLEQSQGDMKALLREQTEIAHNIELNTVELKGIAKLTEKRLQILEDRK